MQPHKFRSLVLCAALAAGVSGAALAQPASPPPGEGRAMQQGMTGPGKGRPDPEAMAARHTERLRAVLQLTPAQEPALKAFVAAMKPPGDMREKMAGRRQEAQGLTTPERLDRMKAHMAERQAAFDRRAEATKRFYAQLTPSQQKAFDAMPMRGHGGGHGGGHGKGPMGGHGMDGKPGMGGRMGGR
jgi:hypothetical protein